MNDRYELYKLAFKKAKEAGYNPTKDRVWDQFVSIAMRHYPSCLKKHEFDKYWQLLKREEGIK